MGWYPMAKGVGNLYRYREISLSANHKYFDALANVQDYAQNQHTLRTLARTIRHNGRSYRVFNPAEIRTTWRCLPPCCGVNTP